MVTVGFQQAMYIAEEGATVSVCVELSGLTERSVLVSVETVAASAHSK